MNEKIVFINGMPLLIRVLSWFTYNGEFKVDSLQIILVATKYIYVSQLFISRMPKMRAILQLVSAPLNPIPTAEHFSRGTQREYSSKPLKQSIVERILLFKW